MTRGLSLVSLVLSLTCPPPLRGQERAHEPHAATSSSRPAVDAFVRRAREGTDRYRDQRVAVEDGYRRLGPDFPAMGEHWANPELVSKGVLDAAHPGLLTYVRVNGVPTLTGVVYAIPLSDGENPPDSPFDPSHWHDHLGSVDEESLLLTHETSRSTPTGMRLAVLHLWTRVENPDGPSVTDNWSLPYVRLGLTAPRHAPLGTARALSLVSGSASFYADLARVAGSPTTGDQRRIDAALGRGTDSVRAWWTRRGSSMPLTPDEIAFLDEAWTGIRRTIEQSVEAPVVRKLDALWHP